MDRLFGIQYAQGYTSALQDVISTIDDIQMDLKLHKRKQAYKTYRGIVECMLKNRVILREDPLAFVRCDVMMIQKMALKYMFKTAIKDNGGNTVKEPRLIQKRTCPICKKEFYISTWQDWQWKVSANGAEVCSYTCIRTYENQHKTYRTH